MPTLTIKLEGGDDLLEVDAASDIESQIRDELELKEDIETPDWEIVGEYEGWGDIDPSALAPRDLQRVAEAIDIHGDSFIAFYLEFGDISHYANSYCGEYANEEVFAETQFTSTRRIPQDIIEYIDWRRVARDLRDAFRYVDAPSGRIYVFGLW